MGLPIRQVTWSKPVTRGGVHQGVLVRAAVGVACMSLQRTSVRLRRELKVLVVSVGRSCAQQAAVLLQVGRYRNMGHAMTTIVRQEGVPALYRGLGASILSIIPEAAITYGVLRLLFPSGTLRTHQHPASAAHSTRSAPYMFVPLK